LSAISSPMAIRPNGRFTALSRRRRRHAETLLERPVFGVERPLSNPWRIRGSCGRDVPIKCRRRDPEAVRYLSHANVEIGEHRLGGLNVIVREFRRTPSRAASAPRGGEARLGALPDQTALEFRQRAKHVKNGTSSGKGLHEASCSCAKIMNSAHGSSAPTDPMGVWLATVAL
jgi:hypothetical protein